MKLKPLIIAYARDLKVLIVDDVKSNLEFYKVAFGKYFSVCDEANDGQEALDMYNKNPNYYDLIVTDVEMPRMSGLELVEEIRKKNMNQSIIVITAVTDLGINQNLAFHFIDGLLTKPVNNTKLYTLLYRILKTITEKIELKHYVSDLENESNQALEYMHHFELIIKKLNPLINYKEVAEVTSIIKVLIGKSETIQEEVETQIQKIKISDDVKKNIRYTHDTIVSAQELCEDLDDSIFDKIDEFNEIIEDWIMLIDKFSLSKDKSSMNYLKEIIDKITSLSEIIYSIGLFPIIANTLTNLINFLRDITYDDIFTHERDKFLVEMLLGLEDDLGKWVTLIFIERDAPNVHYLDASIANNVLEIEAIFRDQTLDDDEDDLEFF